MDVVTIQNRTRNTVIAERAEMAVSWWARLRGLIGRRELAAGSGLLIRPCSSIHTCFMAFPIDVLFVDRNDRALQCHAAVPAWRFGPVAPKARYVIELPPGALAASGTQPGDQIECVRRAMP